VTFAEDLTSVATDLNAQLQIFQKETFATLSVELYSNLGSFLDRKRERCETEPTLQKADPSLESLKETMAGIIGAMQELADLVKGLAVLREGYVRPQGAGSMAPGLADLEAVRKPHDEVRQKLKDLAGDVERAAQSVARYGGALNSSQQTSEERRYRSVFTRMEGEYQRGLRRSG
jgi:hypothetical protein